MNCPLFNAIYRRDLVECNRLVMEEKVPLSYTEYDTTLTALYLAAGTTPELVRFFLPYFPQVDVKFGRGFTPLHKACSCGLVESVQLLLEAGANPSGRDEEGCDPLWTVHNRQNAEPIFELLLNAGAQVTLPQAGKSLLFDPKSVKIAAFYVRRFGHEAMFSTFGIGACLPVLQQVALPMTPRVASFRRWSAVAIALCSARGVWRLSAHHTWVRELPKELIRYLMTEFLIELSN
jgi:hypothetical protein